MVLCTWHGDRYEFRDGAPTADGVLLLGELAMMLYDAKDFASEAGSLQRLSTTGRWWFPCGGEACVVACVVWGQQATNQCHQSIFLLEGHTSNTTCIRMVVLLRICVRLRSQILESTGLHESMTWESPTTWTIHHASPWYAVITEASPVVC